MSQQSGMTLLELLIVVTILSAVAFMSLSQVTDNTAQVRYEDTRNRLQVLREAIIGHQRPVFNGQRLFSGYAADNGLLPTEDTSVQALLVKPDTDMDVFGAQQPMFDPQPEFTTGYNNGGTGEVAVVGASLYKGWRGRYLTTGPGSGGKFLDGWGNDSGDSDHGWLVADVDDADLDMPIALTLATRGRDGWPAATAPAPEAPFDDDIATEIAQLDWMVDAATLEVTVTNNTAADIDMSALGATYCLRVSLLVYRNHDQVGTDGRWRRLTSECVTGANDTGTNSCLDGSDSDTTVAGQPCQSSKTVAFTGSDYDNGGVGTLALDTMVPQGRHLLVLVTDDDSSTKHTTGAGESLCDNSGGCPSASYSTATVDLFAGVSTLNAAIQVAN